MPDDIIAERVRALETWQAIHMPCVPLARATEQLNALSVLVDKYVELKSYHNDVLEGRVTDLEKTYASVHAKLTAIIAVGGMLLAGVITLLFEAFKKGFQ